MAAQTKPQYYISAGVRRALAARELGLTDIAAVIVVPGQPDVLTRIPLDQLRCPKQVVPRDSRYLRVEYAMRAGIPLHAIEVQPLGAPMQTGSVALAQVVLQ